MSEKHLEPAASIIKRFGADVLASVVGKHPSRVYRWRAPKESGGTGGSVPHDDAVKLLAYVFEGGERLRPSDFFPPVDGMPATEERA